MDGTSIERQIASLVAADGGEKLWRNTEYGSDLWASCQIRRPRNSSSQSNDTKKWTIVTDGGSIGPKLELGLKSVLEYRSLGSIAAYSGTKELLLGRRCVVVWIWVLKLDCRWFVGLYQQKNMQQPTNSDNPTYRVVHIRQLWLFVVLWLASSPEAREAEKESLGRITG